jgi:LPS-assembly lipoprotein
MSSFNRRSVVVLLALGGCGFTPALRTGGPARQFLGTVRAQDPKDQQDFDFVASIEDRLGRPDVVQYDLRYSIVTASEGVAITAEGAITRYNLTGAVDWTLTRVADGERLAGGREDSLTSYSATGSTVAGLKAEEDAARRLMTILADQIVARLMVLPA